MINLFYRLVNWTLGTQLRSFPESTFTESNRQINPISKVDPIPFDYKILIIAGNEQEAVNYANKLLLDPHQWQYVVSKQAVHYFDKDKCEIHLTGNWYRSTHIQELINWASKSTYTII